MPKRTYAGAFMRRGGRRPFVRRMRPRPAQRGFLRTGGYYGRFRGRYAGSRRGDQGPELKFHDVDVDDGTVAQGAQIFTSGSINLIAQGTSESQRIGRKCIIKSINWRWNVTLPEVNGAATPSAGDIVRVILYLDKQTNGAIATNTDILATSDYQSFNNLANKSRFRILYDKTIVISYRTLTSTQDADTFDQCAEQRPGVFFKKCSIPLEFSADTGALTEIRSNNLNVLLVSANGTAGFFSKIRLRFSDN